MAISEKDLLKKLSEMDEADLLEMALNLEKLSDGPTASEKRPETDDELHDWVLQATGINIPRVAATPDTNAPFEWFSDLFFERERAVLVVASRGSGKSFLSALFNFTMCYWFKEVECMSVGAIEEQAKNVYNHIRTFQDIAADKLKMTLVKPGQSQQSFTKYFNNSRYKIVTGSKKAVNGPHDSVVHRDEIELMDKEVYLESLNIEKAKVNSDGELINTRTLLTSTRKTSMGLMQEIIDNCEQAVKEGRTPPFKIYWTNVYDVSENRPDCRVAFPDLPESEKCNCNTVTSGEWEKGNPRTFEDACGGKLGKAQGFSPLADAQSIFERSPRFLWEAQQENKRPYVEDISIPEFSKERHGIRDYKPLPENGRIYNAIDFGGRHPFGISYFQVLDHDVYVLNHAGVEVLIQEGTKVMFKEIYKGDIGNQAASELIKAFEDEMRRKYGKEWKVWTRFGDKAATAARKDFTEWGLPTQWPAVTREREVHLERLRTVIQNDEFRYDIGNCKVFEEQMSVWHIDGKKEFDDMVDSALYNNTNVYAIETQGRGKKGRPAVKERGYKTRQGNPFHDRIGISVKQNEIGGMTSQGWLDSVRRR